MMESRFVGIRHVMKGKRTKRLRLQSSLAFSQSDEAFLEVHNNGGSNVFCSYSSLDQIQTSADEEGEEQDMAYCLILLAQGVRSHETSHPISNSPNSHLYSPTPATSPISFPATGKMARSYDYECKTCGRTFHSFQALGGHRASHKKPKAISAIEDTKEELQLSFEEEEEAEIKNRLSLSLNPSTESRSNKSSKIHECSICGAEFSSGQALGGHMRRHRAPLMAASPMEEVQNWRKRNGIWLDLDLNLPAQAEDDQDRRSKLARLINSKQQQKRHESPHAFSSLPVVDCHY